MTTRRSIRARRTALSVTLLAAALLLGACTSSKPDPAQARRDRVEKRLQETFSDAQATCIVERSDPAVILALDRTSNLAPNSKELAAYSDAVATCVTDPNATNTTTIATTTSAP